MKKFKLNFLIASIVLAIITALLLTVTWFKGEYKKDGITKRPLISLEGTVKTGSGGPGGTDIPKSDNPDVNCAGDSCYKDEWIIWPGLDISGTNTAETDWEKTRSFIPDGCTKVSCADVSVNGTRCQKGETELITYLYRWPLNDSAGKVTAWQSDFHMIGRDMEDADGDGELDAKPWHSKKDRRERCNLITDAEESLYKSYPRTLEADREIEKLCFCCTGCTTTTTPQ